MATACDNVVSANTESGGRFRISAKPLPLGLGADLGKPLRLILTRKGRSAAELTGKGLERWRAGLGL